MKISFVIYIQLEYMYLNPLWFSKFSHLEIIGGVENHNVGTFPLWENFIVVYCCA